MNSLFLIGAQSRTWSIAIAPILIFDWPETQHALVVCSILLVAEINILDPNTLLLLHYISLVEF